MTHEPTTTRVLRGKVAIVTGASSGLGKRFVRTLSAAAANVVVTARRAGRLEDLQQELGAERVHVMAGDVCDAGFPAELVRSAVERYGRLDVLVNNAGIGNVTPAEDEATDDFLRVVMTNLVALFACCREAYRPMCATGGGSIINIASMLGTVGIGRIPQASYCASKGGVVNLTRELAAQWASDGVRVNAIGPGWFPSEMTADMMEDERSRAYIARTVPMRRPGKVDELDGTLLFLAGSGSTYVTGQTIVVDGGFTSV